MDQFYLTLPSNSSMDVFPDNTVAEFTTKLHHRLELQGQWEVALVEIQYPISFHNITSGKNVVLVRHTRTSPSPFTRCTIPVGYYHSMDRLLDVINNLPMLRGNATFKYNSVTGHVEFKSDDRVTVFLYKGLAQVLGYLPNTTLQTVSPHPAALYHNVPNQLYVYADIVEPQLVGDTVAPLLRIVGVEDRTYEKMVVKIYDSPHYISVLKRSFETITIDIRTTTGSKVPFEFGTLNAKLHFRQLSR